jgi:hypothetical protein
MNWREVPGWEGFYAVSDTGLVKSLARTVERLPSAMTLRERELNIGVHTDGYHVVYLARGGERTQFRVHRLVLTAFVGPCPEGMEGCHNDGNPINNHLDNLRWDTRSANAHDTVRHGAHPMASKTHCKSGHPYNALNTYVSPGSSKRTCRTCRLVSKRRYNNRKKAAA